MDSTGLSLFSFFFFFPFFLFTYTALCSAHPCPPSSCSPVELSVFFPFRLINQQPDRCGFPGFDLSCNNRSQTVIDLPSGRFLVKRIDYASQSININDPDFCLPKRILSLNFSGSGFVSRNPRSITFFNCSKDSTYLNYRAAPIGCLSSRNFTVMVMDSQYATYTPELCSRYTVEVPVQSYSSYVSWTSLDLSDDLQLSWFRPYCGSCVLEGGTCGFKSGTKLDVKCSGLPRKGLPRSAKYGLILGVGIPGLIFILGLACYIGGKVRAYGHRNQLSTELSTANVTNRSTLAMTGLDEITIESFPKTVLDESGQLPKPNDGPCSICLCEFLPKDTLRTIPKCSHYFHADCIDEWLKMNATCPMCRTPPETLSVVTPCSSRSSMLSSSSSSAS